MNLEKLYDNKLDGNRKKNCITLKIYLDKLDFKGELNGFFFILLVLWRSQF